MIKKSEGNSLIILLMKVDDTEFDDSKNGDNMISLYEKYLYDPKLIAQLAEKGLQPSVDVLAKNFMVDLEDSRNSRKGLE